MSGMPIRTDAAGASLPAAVADAPARTAPTPPPPPTEAPPQAVPAADVAHTSAQGSAGIVSLFDVAAEVKPSAATGAAMIASRQFLQQVQTMVAYWQDRGSEAPIEAVHMAAKQFLDDVRAASLGAPMSAAQLRTFLDGVVQQVGPASGVGMALSTIFSRMRHFANGDQAPSRPAPGTP